MTRSGSLRSGWATRLNSSGNPSACSWRSIARSSARVSMAAIASSSDWIGAKRNASSCPASVAERNMRPTNHSGDPSGASRCAAASRTMRSSRSLLRSSISLKVPQLEYAGGTGLRASQPPLAYWLKSSQAEMETSRSPAASPPSAACAGTNQANTARHTARLAVDPAITRWQVDSAAEVGNCRQGAGQGQCNRSLPESGCWRWLLVLVGQVDRAAGYLTAGGHDARHVGPAGKRDLPGARGA